MGTGIEEAPQAEEEYDLDQRTDLQFVLTVVRTEKVYGVTLLNHLSTPDAERDRKILSNFKTEYVRTGLWNNTQKREQLVNAALMGYADFTVGNFNMRNFTLNEHETKFLRRKLGIEH